MMICVKITLEVNFFAGATVVGQGDSVLKYIIQLFLFQTRNLFFSKLLEYRV